MWSCNDFQIWCVVFRNSVTKFLTKKYLGNSINDEQINL